MTRKEAAALKAELVADLRAIAKDQAEQRKVIDMCVFAERNCGTAACLAGHGVAGQYPSFVRAGFTGIEWTTDGYGYKLPHLASTIPEKVLAASKELDEFSDFRKLKLGFHFIQPEAIAALFNVYTVAEAEKIDRVYETDEMPDAVGEVVRDRIDAFEAEDNLKYDEGEAAGG